MCVCKCTYLHLCVCVCASVLAYIRVCNFSECEIIVCVLKVGTTCPAHAARLRLAHRPYLYLLEKLKGEWSGCDGMAFETSGDTRGGGAMASINISFTMHYHKQ